MIESKVSDMNKEEYREWMKKDLNAVLLKNESAKVDEIVAAMIKEDSGCTSVDPEEYKEFLSC